MKCLEYLYSVNLVLKFSVVWQTRQEELASLPFVPSAPAGPWAPSLAQEVNIKHAAARSKPALKSKFLKFFIPLQFLLINTLIEQTICVNCLETKIVKIMKD
jgi:hypothetical protein